MKICRARPQLVFTFDNQFSSIGWVVPQSVWYRIFSLQASYLSATSHTGRESCRVKSLYMKRFWLKPPFPCKVQIGSDIDDDEDDIKKLTSSSLKINVDAPESQNRMKLAIQRSDRSDHLTTVMRATFVPAN
jgi:hypothetical protein